MKVLKVCGLRMLAAFALFVGGVAHAQIPTTDVIGIAARAAEHAAEIAKWEQQYKQMEAQINSYKDQYDQLRGSRGMGALFDNQRLLPNDWQDLLKNARNSALFKAYRADYPTVEGWPKTNAMFDVMATQKATMDDLFGRNQERMKQIRSLMGQIDSAEDPAAKQDLTNRLVNESNSIQATQNLLSVLQAKQQNELETARRAAQAEYTCKEFKKPGC